MTRLEVPEGEPDARAADTFDERWAAWQARGLRREARSRARLRIVLAAGLVAAVAAAIWLVQGA